MGFPTPEDIRKDYEQKNSPVIEEFLTECKEQLMLLGPSGGTICPKTDLPFNLRGKVAQELAKSGWCIEFHSSQRDGEWVNINPSAVTPSTYYEDRSNPHPLYDPSIPSYYNK